MATILVERLHMLDERSLRIDGRQAASPDVRPTQTLADVAASLEIAVGQVVRNGEVVGRIVEGGIGLCG